VTCGVFAPRHSDQFGRLPAAPPRLLDIVQQPGQQGAVDDLETGSTTRTRDQQSTTAVKLGPMPTVLDTNRLIDDLFREHERRWSTRCTEQTQRIIGITRRSLGSWALRRLRRLPLGLVPLATVLTHGSPPNPIPASRQRHQADNLSDAPRSGVIGLRAQPVRDAPP
jgi:hypothetical protein